MRKPANSRVLSSLATLLAFAFPGSLHAQEPQPQPAPIQSQAVPFTAWLDFKELSKPDASNPPLPIWMESVQMAKITPDSAGNPTKTVFRLRLRNFPGLNDEIMLRLYFLDKAGAQPVITTWTEIGAQVGEPKTLGSGVGMGTNETVLITTKGVDYIDIETPGDASNLRGALISSLKSSTTKQALDFDSPAALSDPFQAAAPATPPKNDSLLFGRVKATLDDSVVKVSGTGSNLCVYEFELAHQPLMAVVSFELLNADPAQAPQLIANNVPLGEVSQQLPDIADPAFRGTVRPLSGDMRFRYNGWIKCQKAIPGSALTAGLNKLTVQTVSDGDGFAIRAVEIQLKYSAQTLDYDIKP